MDLEKLVIATMSWARDKEEEDVLRMALKQLSSLDIPVFVTDGGSPEVFVNEINELNRFTVMPSTTKGLWPQVKTSLQKAYDSGEPFILYTEPDKHDYFKALPQVLKEVYLDEQIGAVLATRSAAGFASYPSFQQMTESTINNCCAEIVKQNIDYTYGPFLLNRNVVPILQTLPDNVGWGWRTCAFNVAARMGLQVTTREGDYFCPEDQRQDDPTERVYRMKQLIQSIEGLVLSTAMDL